MCTYYFILSWTGLLCTGDDWAHEEGWVSADPLWQWWCWPGSHQHLSACRMYCVHHCWYSGETGLHQKAISTGTWMACEETVNLGNICCHLAHNLLSFHLLSISLKRLYRTLILHIVLYGFVTSFFALRKEHQLKAFQSRILKKIFWAYEGGRNWRLEETA